MKEHRTGFRTIAPLIASLWGALAAGDDYFPLQEGNYWVYHVADGRRVYHPRVIRCVEEQGHTALLQVGSATYRVRSSGSDLRIELPEEGFVLWYRFEQGSQWERRDPFSCDDHTTVSVAPEPDPVVTPAGTFTNCLRLQFRGTPCLDGGTFFQVFAPGVGLVLSHENSFTGTRSYALREYCVSGPVCRDAQFRRGDANTDSRSDVADAVFCLSYLFRSGPEPACRDAADANDDGKIDLADPITLLRYLFDGTAALPPPYPDCGRDPTRDRLSCRTYPPCEPVSCEEAISRIARESSLVGSCSCIVRLSHETNAVLGWQMICGRYRHVSEQEAREAAERDTGFGSGIIRNPPGLRGLYIFYRYADNVRRWSIVSARTGLTVFGAFAPQDGLGEITYPTSWRPPEELPFGCEEIERKIPRAGYDLATGRELGQGPIDDPLGLVWETALPLGLATAGYLFDALVLYFPRQSHMIGDVRTAEWIVILNAGWLE